MRNIAQGVTGGGIKTDPVTNIVEMTPQFTCKHPYTYLYWIFRFSDLKLYRYGKRERGKKNVRCCSTRTMIIQMMMISTSFAEPSFKGPLLYIYNWCNYWWFLKAIRVGSGVVGIEDQIKIPWSLLTVNVQTSLLPPSVNLWNKWYHGPVPSVATNVLALKDISKNAFWYPFQFEWILCRDSLSTNPLLIVLIKSFPDITQLRKKHISLVEKDFSRPSTMMVHISFSDAMKLH